MPSSRTRRTRSVSRRARAAASRRGAAAPVRAHAALAPRSPARHHALLVGLGAAELAAQPALVHDQHAVGHAEHLGQLAGDHQHGEPAAGELATSAGAPRPWCRRRCRASARRGSAASARWRATCRARPSAGCRRRGSRPGRRAGGTSAAAAAPIRAARRVLGAAADQPERARAPACRVSVALRAIDRSITRPCWRRSSGTSAMPGAHGGERPARRGSVPAGDLDVAGVGPVDAEDRPRDLAAARRRRARPARRSRRARTSKLTSKNTPSRVRRSTSSTRLADLGRPAWGTARRARARPSAGPSRRSSCPRPRASCTTAPSRMTVTVSQIAKTSSRRCEMNSTAAPALPQRAHDARTAARPRARQRGGRLVHDQHARVEAQRLGDLDDLLVGDREAAHRPVAGRACTPRRSSRPWTCACSARRSIRRPRPSGWRPIITFSATERSGNSVGSW